MIHMSNIRWEDSYVGNLRKMIGHQPLIHPSVRALIFNEDGDILFIERRRENKWGMPAGSMELNESIYDCLVREVKEETGIEVHSATLVGIYTNPSKSMTNQFGDHYQMFEFVFRVDEWAGSIKKETDETTNARFFPLDDKPEASSDFWDMHHREVIKDYKQFKGNVIIK